MKIRIVSFNNHRKGFEVGIRSRSYWYPFARLEHPPGPADPIVRVFVDPELGGEAFTYVLKSGREDSIHAEQVLEHNQDPSFLREQILYRLTIEARRGVARSPLSKREIARRLGTSAAQLYRLLDPANRRKSIDHLLRLLSALDCEVDVVVRAKSA